MPESPAPRRRLGGATAVGVGIFLSRVAGLVPTLCAFGPVLLGRGSVQLSAFLDGLLELPRYRLLHRDDERAAPLHAADLAVRHGRLRGRAAGDVERTGRRRSARRAPAEAAAARAAAGRVFRRAVGRRVRVGLTASAGFAAWIEFLLLERWPSARIGKVPIPARLGFGALAAAAVAGAAGYGAAAAVHVTISRTVPRSLAAILAFGAVYFAIMTAARVPEARGLARRVVRRR